jgi:hypothetical protein
MRPIADQTIQELEGVDYGEPTYNNRLRHLSYVALRAKWESYVGQGFVVTNTHRLPTSPLVLRSSTSEVGRLRRTRPRVPIKRFALDDLRFMIGQREGLPWLMPRALAHLARHPLAGGRWHYRGSLLNAVISVPDAFWQAQPLWRAQVSVVIASALKRIHKVDVPEDFEAELRAAMPRFA